MIFVLRIPVVETVLIVMVIVVFTLIVVISVLVVALSPAKVGSSKVSFARGACLFGLGRFVGLATWPLVQ